MSKVIQNYLESAKISEKERQFVEEWLEYYQTHPKEDFEVFNELDQPEEFFKKSKIGYGEYECYLDIKHEEIKEGEDKFRKPLEKSHMMCRMMLGDAHISRLVDHGRLTIFTEKFPKVFMRQFLNFERRFLDISSVSTLSPITFYIRKLVTEFQSYGLSNQMVFDVTEIPHTNVDACYIENLIFSLRLDPETREVIVNIAFE